MSDTLRAAVQRGKESIRLAIAELQRREAEAFGRYDRYSIVYANLPKFAENLARMLAPLKDTDRLSTSETSFICFFANDIAEHSAWIICAPENTERVKKFINDYASECGSEEFRCTHSEAIIKENSSCVFIHGSGEFAFFTNFEAFRLSASSLGLGSVSPANAYTFESRPT